MDKNLLPLLLQAGSLMEGNPGNQGNRKKEDNKESDVFDMRTNLLVVDGFYHNVDDTRKFALDQEFDVIGNYPGKRTKPFNNESTKDKIQNFIYPHGGEVTDWLEDEDQYCGSFQMSYATDRSWIHTDDHNNWAGVLYLTPDAPTTSGTGFYRSKINGSIYGKNDDVMGDYAQDKTQWDLIGEVHNLYNRLVLFRADQWHTSMEYFGNNNENGRLTQVFFFSTEY
tara:strand:- start:1513 stop:2187 length:675 start_codon:yes stop_codon:yes gene_type:complete